MKRIHLPSLFWVAVLCLSSLAFKAAAADVLTPCFLKVSIYTNLPGAAVTDFTGDPTYPAKPGEVRYLRAFNTRDAIPNDTLQDFGGRIEGFLTPLESGEYHFFLRSDSQSQLWISSDDKEANAAQIAEEPDRGDPFMEPDAGDSATSPPVALVAGKRYFIMVLYKGNSGGGNSTDFAQVAWRKVGDTTRALLLKPIPAAFLSTMASDAQASKVTITLQPKDVSGEENSKVTFVCVATNAPAAPLCIQWQRNGVNIPGATGTNYTRFLDKADHGVKFRAVIAVPGASMNSAEVTATVTDDKTRPTIAAAKGGPNRPEVTLTFSERVNPTTATATANYKIAAANGAALAVTAAALSADRTQVTLQTAQQTPGTEYTVTVNNVTDLAAAAPNAVAANTTAKFFARGPLIQGEDGFVVWEAEDYDRNPDGLWFADTERGVASGGVSMVNYNGAGGGENNTKLEYDIFFPQTGTNIIWWRFSGNDGNDDSAWIHLDGARPVGREAGNLAAIGGTGTSLAGNWGWTASPFEGGGQMTFVIDTPGVHSIAIARREDGSYVDKFVITRNPGFNPTTVFGAFGPPLTLRQGEPLPPGLTFEITQQPASVTGLEHSAISIVAQVALPQGVLSSTQWQRKQGNAFADIPGATLQTNTISRLTMDWNGAVLRLKVSSSGVTKYSDEATITVTPETTPPDLLAATGLALQNRVTLRFSEPLNAATAGTAGNYQITGSSGALAVTSATVLPGQRSVMLATGAQTVGTKYTVTVSRVTDQAATPNAIVNGTAKFYSLGALQPQGADGLLVFEAEAYDRNLDNLWVENNSRGNPSGGISVVVPTGGSETATQLEYDLNFTKTGTNILWYRASGNDGSSDSSWFWIDGARPANRATANQASMSGFGSQQDFVWRSAPQEGGGQYTFVINTTGPHIVGLGRRENNAHFDKFAITTDPAFNPNDYGPFGPPETRAGSPALPTLTITSPVANAQFEAGADIPITVAVSQTTRVITKVEFFRATAKIGESAASPYNFTWQNAPAGTNNITARLTDDVGDVVGSRAVAVIVNPAAGGPAPKFTAFRIQGGNLVLEWTGTGRLQSSPVLPGQWVDVPNAASPFTVAPSGPQRFYRVAQ
ncbi:MAG: Ig-like domain-containing protein [Verrucomicrobia bacterium]|nr:Ig-like domain-containing protein [Verrucomicrobiota bacterium]